ncbi:hypothetical protein [Nostoc sp. CHAB 5715]|uniref:hypothetical protein n=1 Tax=Nostoc sp. CHAB 5715 TaxID=2780400 RepID=UPI001E319408|nr:hypothetical protein [Nostoc sp. CHAB 5715]MCC5625236.1 hypothetical protein [Nostoc sp. CHAB 5715]
MRQLEADRRHWDKRLNMLAEELVREPARIEATYEVKAVRVEPVGIVYQKRRETPSRKWRGEG